MLRRMIAVVACVALAVTSSQAATYSWTNAAGGNWSVVGNWSAAPVSAVDTTLVFPTFLTQISAPYTATNDIGPFDVNSMQFNVFGSTALPILMNSSVAANVARFNLDGAILPSIANNGTSNVTFNTLVAQINNGTTLRFLSSNLGSVTMSTAIGQAGVGNGAVEVATTGSSFLGAGAVVAFNGANTYAGGLTLTSGNVTYGNAAGLGAAAGTVTINGANHTLRPTTSGLTVANNFVLNQTLNLTGAFTATSSATYSGAFTGVGGINAVNTSSGLTYTFTNGGNSFAGAVTFNPFGNAVGGIALSGNGAFTGTSSISMFSNTSLILDNSGTNVTNRVVDSAGINFNRSNLTFIGNAGAASSESLGVWTTTGTSSMLITPNAAQPSSVTFASWTRNLNSTAIFNSTGLGGAGANTGNFVFTADPGGAIGGGGAPGSTNMSILPYAFGNSASAGAPIPSFVRYNAGPIVPLNLGTEYASNMYLTGTSAPTNNMRLTSTAANSLSGSAADIRFPTTINSLILNTDTTTAAAIGNSLSGSANVTITSGAILSSITGSTSLPTLAGQINAGGINFGANPGYVHTLANLIINSPISGSGGVVKSGFGELILNGNNTFAGDVYVNSGILRIANDSNLGAPANQLFLNGGLTSQLLYNPGILVSDAPTNTFLLSRQINIGPAGTSLATGTNGMLDVTSSTAGAGQLYVTGGYVRLLNPANGHTGSTLIFSTVGTQADLSLGTNPTVAMGGGILVPEASYASAKDYFIQASSGFDVRSGVAMQIDGRIGGQNSATTLTKLGGGSLTLTAANQYSGAVVIGDSTPFARLQTVTGAQTGGAVILNGPNGALALASAVTINPGSALVLDNSGVVGNINNNRIGSVVTTLAGGTLAMIGNANGSTTEFIGGATGLVYSARNSVVNIIQPVSVSTNESTTLVATTLSPTNPGTIRFGMTNAGAPVGDRSVVLFNTNPTLTNGMIASATIANNAPFATDFATTVPSGTQFSLVPFAGYAGPLPAAGGLATAVYDNVGPTVMTGANAAQALRLGGAGGGVDLAGFVLTMSGTATNILALPGNTGIVDGSGGLGALAFGANPARVIASAPLMIGTPVAPVAMTGTSSFNKSGPAPVTVFGTATSNIPTVIVNEGVLVIGNVNAFATGVSGGVAGAMTSNFAVNAGATLDLSGAALPPILYVPTFSTGFGTVNIGTKTLSTGSASATIGRLTGGAGAVFRLGVPLAEVAGNTFGGSTITLNGDNSGYAGGIEIYRGTLSVQTSTALGTGLSPIIMGDTGGTGAAVLSIGPNISNFGRDIIVQAGSTGLHRITGSSNVITNISSNISLGQLLEISLGATVNGGSYNFTGTISGPGSINHFNGNASFSGNNTFSGGFALDANPNLVIGIGSDSTPLTGALGTGPISFTTFGGALKAVGGPRIVSNNIATTGTSTNFAIVGTNNLTFDGTLNYATLTGAFNMNVTNAGTTSFNGAITGGQAINKNGPGTVVFGSPTGNAIGGLTTVNAGKLVLTNTSGNAAGAITVNTGAVLGGTGSAAGPLTVAGGIVSPGLSPGILTINSDVTFTGGIFEAELQGLIAGTQYDQLAVTAGNVNLGAGVATLSLLPSGYTPMTTDVFVIVNNTGGGTLTGTFAGLADQTIVASNVLGSGIDYYIYYGSYPSFGNDVVIAPVPEPATVLGICAVGFGAAGYIRRRFKKTTTAV